MKFDRPTLFIDPSFSCSGLCLVEPEKKQLTFDGISRAETKRDLSHYYNAAKSIAENLRKYLCGLEALYGKEFQIVMEAPFPGSFASSGLFMLQGLLLEAIQQFGVTLYSLSPSYISGQIKKACNKQDGIGIRKKWCAEVLETFVHDGWSIKNAEILKAAGCDPQTAFGFYYFLSRTDKVLGYFVFE